MKNQFSRRNWVCYLFFLVWLSISVNAQDSVFIIPVEYTRAVRNPLKGFKEWNTNTNNEWSTVGKMYVGWNELENSASDGVDKIINWSNDKWDGVEDKNFKVIPRVWLDYPGRDPAWPADMTVGDFTSEQFKARVKAFIKKLGLAWDNDPRVAYIEMGIIGKWGEHHSPEPAEEMQDILAIAFMDAFKNKKVIIRYPWQFTDYSFGIYWDSFAHANEVVTHEPAMMALGDYWKTAIVEGETAYNWGDYKIQPGDGPDDTMIDTVHRHYLEDLIYKLHCTGLGWVTHYDASIPEAKEGGEEVQRTFGYRFVVNEFTYPKTIEIGTPFDVSFSVINKGSAPFYYHWPVELSLLDADKSVVWRQNFSNVDIRKWVPGDDYNKSTREYELSAVENTVTGTFTMNESLSSGTYTLALSILDPAGNLPSLRFAIENYFDGGRHPLGHVGIGMTPVNPEINPDDFDDLHADQTLHYDADFKISIPVKIIFDCDFGDDGDDLAALLMLHHMQDHNECEIIAIGQCNSTPAAPAAIDIINTYYGRPDIPIGQQQSNTHKGDQYITFLRDNYPELTDLDGSYSPDVIDLYRRTLAAAPDSSVKFIVVGLKKDMADLLKSAPDEHSSLSGSDLVAQKVIGIYDMGGKYPSGKEFNFELEGESTKYYVENSLVPIFFHGTCWGGMHVGEELRDMDTPPGRAMDHKLAGNGGIYWDGKPVEDYQHAFDCAPVFAAVRGENTYFNLVSGCNNISSDGSNSFDTESSCDHVYADCNNKKVSFEKMADEIEAMITADPLFGYDGKYLFTASIVGKGSVTPENGKYAGEIDIIATPDEGYGFEGWSGDITSANQWEAIRMDSNINVTATFIPTTSVSERNDNELHFTSYPNPFVNSTNIRYKVTTLSFVKLSIYNTLSQEVITLVNENRKNGVYNVVWNGVDASGSRVNSGIYLCKLQVGQEVFANTLILSRN